MSFTFRHYRHEIRRWCTNTKCKDFVIYLCMLLEFEFHSFPTCTITFEVQKLSFKCVERDIRCGCTCTVPYFLNVFLKVLERLWTLKDTCTGTFSKLFKVFKQTIHCRCIHIPEDPLDSPRENLHSSANKTTVAQKKRHPREKKKRISWVHGSRLVVARQKQKNSCVHGSAIVIFQWKSHSRENMQYLREKIRPTVLTWQSLGVNVLFRCFIQCENWY